jgi:hypothetical protein
MKILTYGPRDNLQGHRQSWLSRKKHEMCAQLVQPDSAYNDREMACVLGDFYCKRKKKYSSKSKYDV